jgi:uncharacterized protein (DUF2236 family)
VTEGYFTDESMLRRINRERVLAISGPRALLMQAAHPLAVSGLLAHTDSLEEPYARLGRVAQLLSTISFGPRDDADRLTARVRKMHAQVRGTLDEDVGVYPAGTPYRADDSELLMWVLFTLVDSAVVVYRKYIGRLSRADEGLYWEDFKIVGELFGLRRADMPDSIEDLDEYRREMLEGDTLYVTDWARTRGRQIVLDPPVSLAKRPLVETANFITIALLPDTLREQYGFSRIPPTAVRKALVAGGASYIKRGVVPFLPNRIRYVPESRLRTAA